jgi:site-specific recombinase XerD
MKNNLFIRQLGEYFDTFLPEIRQASANTISAYADSFAILFQFLEEKKNVPHHLVTYKNFTASVFDELLLWMKNERNYSVSSIRGRMTAIVAFLKYASRRDMKALSAYSVASALDLPNTIRTEFPYFSKGEMKILLNLPDPSKYLGERDLVLLSVLYDAGARAQEICNLCVGDIRFGSPTKIKLHGKGRKVREVPVSDEVAALLRYHLKSNNVSLSEKEAPLFSSQTRSKMTTACIRSIVSKYVGVAKSKHPTMFLEKSYSPHSFRHSKAVHMVEAGVDLIYIRNFLGHATIISTEIYARVGQAAVTKALTDRKIPRLSVPLPAGKDARGNEPDFISRARKNM